MLMSDDSQWAISWMSTFRESLHNVPRGIEVCYSRRFGKLTAHLAATGDAAVMALVEHVIEHELSGSSRRVNVGLVNFGRCLTVRKASVLLLANPQGTMVLNQCLLPAVLSRRSRDANDLVKRIATAVETLSNSGECPSFGNHDPPLEARANVHGWLACPGCGLRFSLEDPDFIRQQRCDRCGQRIVAIP